METKFDFDKEQSELQKLASRKVIKLKSFYKQLFIYTIILILYLLKGYTELPLNVFPINLLNGVIMILWAAVVIGSAIDVFASFKIFDEDWEARKVKSILERRNKKQKWE
ncbi:2TM domain-containing protein [Flavobacterium sp. SORGH_AS_0622]|uniref:2TM domain-containing protein n=1 Tax=Flavobacterium sp. SORGH_AS_0622 TaxID=3041772 RepID=UPI002787597E|nr:2TM domain-containing protein [Flavobacterium sp. SORGH_AS_0622]MDQ1167033.1 putative integral membrane protein [Flavobacterium sp. SORGH_AS_0622]